jgi:hypothetical protein
MNRKQRREFNRSMKGKITAEEMEAMNESMEQIASLSHCSKCNNQLDNKNQHHLDNWKISVINEKMILVCDECE